ncbi:MAG: thioredoxin domain-containing protein [Nitrospirales bacterium]
MRHWMMTWCLILWVCVPSAASRELSDSSDLIHWFEWGDPAFQKAQAEDKLILLDLTAVWCHACHVMDETTYVEPDIVTTLNTSVVPVRVDTDQHPDLEARYRAGGWPTTSILLPTGEILFQANALPPGEMKELLHEVIQLYAQDKADLRNQAQVLWKKVQPRPATDDSEQAISPDMVSHAVAFMKNQFDAEHGGFRAVPKFFEPEAVQLALALGFVNKDQQLTHMGLHTLDRQTTLLDPVWGGFYRYAEQADWTDPHYEKMLTIQAGNLQNYLEAFQLTENPSYRTIANSIVDYVWDFLTDHTSGQFWESQDADLRASDGTTLLAGSDFFSLSAEERSKKGQPRIDRRVFTGSNAGMAEAFLDASWILERPELRGLAIQVIRKLDQERWNAGQGLLHGSRAEGVAVSGLLSDHMQLGRALVAAFQSTGEKGFLKRAEHLAARTQAILEDSQGGGFFDRRPDQEGLGLLKMPIKSSQDNLHTALWYLDLFHLTQRHDYQMTAQRTIRAIISAKRPVPIALMGKAVDRWYRGSVHVAVVGVPNDPKTVAFMEEGRRFYYPGKLLRQFNPEQESPQWGEISFPYHGEPLAFACTDRLCSPPVVSPKDLQVSILNIVDQK